MAKMLGGAAPEWVASQRLALLSREAGGYAPAGRDTERPLLTGRWGSCTCVCSSAAGGIPRRVNAQTLTSGSEKLWGTPAYSSLLHEVLGLP